MGGNSEEDIRRAARDTVRNFRGIGPRETVADFAVAVAEHAIRSRAGNGGTGHTLSAVLARAGMSIFGFNTGVIGSTCGAGRVGVRANAAEPWTDCVSLEFMHGDDGRWFPLALSPARARILAIHLLRAAEAREADDPGRECIDSAVAEE